MKEKKRGREREGGREREKETGRQTDRQTEAETKTQRQRQNHSFIGFKLKVIDFEQILFIYHCIIFFCFFLFFLQTGLFLSSSFLAMEILSLAHLSR